MRIVTLVRGRLFVALLTLAAALLLAAACSSGGGGKTPAGQTPAGQTPAGQTPAAGQTPSGATAEIKMIQGTKFDKSELRVPADTDATISVENTDGFHSFYVYASEADAQSGADALAEMESCSAPCGDDVQVNLPAGEHFFRCQVHPSVMKGVIIAE